MARTILVVSLIGVLVFSAIGFVVAQDRGTSSSTGTPSATAMYGTPSATGMYGTPSATGMYASPAEKACPGAAWQAGKTMSSDEMMKTRADQMKAAGASPQMTMRDKMFMCAQLDSADPSALLAASDDLNLTQDQIKKLQDIQKDARDDARDILNDNQKNTVASLAGTPRTMLEMCHQMNAQSASWAGTPSSTGMYGTPSSTGMYGTPSATGMYGATPSATGSVSMAAPSATAGDTSYPMMGCRPIRSSGSTRDNMMGSGSRSNY